MNTTDINERGFKIIRKENGCNSRKIPAHKRYFY